MIEQATKVEVRVGGPDRDGIYRGERVRFTGELVDTFESGQTTMELYECPGGYRVYVDDQRNEEQQLYPHEPNPVTGELDYELYSAEEVAGESPQFGATLGVLRVRDID